MFLGGNTTWQSASSFGGRGGKKPTLWRKTAEANMEGSGWFYPRTHLGLLLIKRDLVLLWRTPTPSQSVKFGQNSNLPPSPPPTPRVVMWLRLGQWAPVFYPPQQLWLCQGWPHGKARLVRLYSQTVTAFWGGKFSSPFLYQLRGATRGYQLGEPNHK